MKKLLLLLLTATVAVSVSASSALVKKAEASIKAKNETQALDYYKQALKEDPTDVEALAGASLMCSRIGNRSSKKSLRSSYFKAANTYADVALKVAPTSAKSNYVKSVALGRIALVSGAKEKVAASRNIKKYAEKALKYDPKHAGAWHVLGRWNYGVATLNIAEKAAAETLFGGLPDGDLATAISCFKKSMAYDPDYVRNYLDLGKAYMKNGDKSQAKAMFAKGMNHKSIIIDDDEVKKECRELYNKI